MTPMGRVNAPPSLPGRNTRVHTGSTGSVPIDIGTPPVATVHGPAGAEAPAEKMWVTARRKWEARTMESDRARDRSSSPDLGTGKLRPHSHPGGPRPPTTLFAHPTSSKAKAGIPVSGGHNRLAAAVRQPTKRGSGALTRRTTPLRVGGEPRCRGGSWPAGAPDPFSPPSAAGPEVRLPPGTKSATIPHSRNLASARPYHSGTSNYHRQAAKIA